jgi:hypothetical protein
MQMCIRLALASGRKADADKFCAGYEKEGTML